MLTCQQEFTLRKALQYVHHGYILNIMNRFNKILLVAKIYLLAIALFFVFRLILFITQLDRLDFDQIGLSTILNAFLIGVRFDIVISGYIMILPAFIFIVSDFFKTKNHLLYKILFYWVFVLYSLAFLICAADIPYFNQFFSRFSVTAFEWADNPAFIFKMIFQEPKYFLYIIPFLIIIIVFYKILKSFISKTKPSVKTNIFLKIFIYLIFLSVLFIGIRGRLAKKSPIRVGTAYFCNDPFLNQLGLNPVFTLIRSYLDSIDERNKSIDLTDNQLAISNVRKSFNINNSDYKSPIARYITPDTTAINKPNVVIIMMESMSAAKMSRYGNTNNLTPFLDSLSNQSIYFENIYSSGIHTYNGVFSTLCSFPTIFRQHPMKTINKFNNISYTLRKHDYSTIYFTTHDGQFDNIEGFLKENDFEQIISQADYPSSEIQSTLGVPDDFMFRYSISILDQKHSENKPFLAAFMTASDHGPYYIPDYFKPKTDDIKTQVTEYADWSLRRFIELSRKTKWFDNTIFVFIADHGAAMNVTYEIPLNYFHTPLIFYAPQIFDTAQTYQCIGGQIDVFPTIMGILNLPYLNNTFGIDLLKEERPYIYINGDDKIGVLDNEYLLIMKNASQDETQLFRYKALDKNNCINENPDKGKEMENYAKSNLQVFQYMLNNKLIFEEENTQSK